MDSKFFEIASYDLKLKVELFTIDYIEKKLGDFIDKNSIHCLQRPTEERPFPLQKFIWMQVAEKDS